MTLRGEPTTPSMRMRGLHPADDPSVVALWSSVSLAQRLIKDD